jgi:hypothetical protein
MRYGSRGEWGEVVVDVGAGEVNVEVAIRQSDLSALARRPERVGLPIVCRVRRQNLGGGFSDHERHPFAWSVIVPVDGVPARLISARGGNREWTSLDRLERWLRAQGFCAWHLHNAIERAGDGVDNGDAAAGSP